MFFEEFYKFSLEFGILPDMLQKSRLYVLFIHFIENFDQMIIKGNNNFYIEVDKFLPLLIFCAIDSKSIVEDNYNFFEKIVLFFERISLAQGLKNCTKQTGSSKLTSDYINTINHLKSLIEKPKPLSGKDTFKEIFLNK